MSRASKCAKCGKPLDREPDTLVEVMTNRGRCWNCVVEWRLATNTALCKECP